MKALIKILFSISLILSTKNNTIFAQNPLAIAKEFNVFTEGDLTISQGDIEGAIAVGGNLIIKGNSQRTSANKTGGIAYVTINNIKYALVVGGGLVGTNGGNIFKVDGKAGATDDHFIHFNSLSGNTARNDGGGIDIGNPPSDNLKRYIRVNSTIQDKNLVESSDVMVDFANAFTEFKAQSVSLTNCTSNITFTNSGGQATVTLGNNPTNVWNITGTDLNNFNQINFQVVLPNINNPLIINVNTSSTFAWQNKNLSFGSENDDSKEINRAPYILWNFYNATTLTISNSSLIVGSILAPFANITNNGSGNITGQLIGKTFTKPQAGELHIAKFNANVVCNSCPNPTTAFAGDDFTNCIGSSIQLNGEIGGAAISGTWTDNGAGGKFTPNANSLDAIYEPSTTFETVTLTLTANTTNDVCKIATDDLLITFSNCQRALPIVLESFEGKIFEKTVALNWKSASETNFSHFEVQKSTNINEFGTIATISGAKSEFYNFIDQTPFEGLNMYRLKMVDIDGSVSYSKIITIIFESNTDFISVENPAMNGEIILSTNLILPQIKVRNITGTAVNLCANNIGNNYSIKLNNYQPGIYFISLTSANGIITKKIIVL
jgi:choice-of-anchor A domain-containing protein